MSKRWTNKLDNELLELRSKGKTITELSKIFDKPDNFIKNKIEKLSIKLKNQGKSMDEITSKLGMSMNDELSAVDNIEIEINPMSPPLMPEEETVISLLREIRDELKKINKPIHTQCQPMGLEGLFNSLSMMPMQEDCPENCD